MLNDNKEKLFGGYGGQWLSVPNPPHFKKVERKQWVKILEQAFTQVTSTEEGKKRYGDPDKGATLEQAWNTWGLITGKEPVCLFVEGSESVTTGSINPIVRVNPKQMVSSLADILGISENTSIPICYDDGNIGHCITLMKYDEDSDQFIYHDPWPEVSLLCTQFNPAGIDAQQTGSFWSITSNELEKIIVAAFVFKYLWSEYLGEKYYTTYPELKASEFWSYFHLTTEEAKPLENNRKLYSIIPGAFQSEIDLRITINSQDRLESGELSIKRSWIFGPPNGMNPFALDIVSSFIAALIPPPDQPHILDLIKIFHQIGDPTLSDKVVEDNKDKPMVCGVISTYLGAIEDFDQPLQFSNYSMKNEILGEESWLRIQINIDLA